MVNAMVENINAEGRVSWDEPESDFPTTEELLATVHEIAFQSMKQDHYWIAEALDLSDEAMGNVMQYLTQYLEGK